MIKAIETRYAGCRFRSRLEARWAVFFNTLGIRWEYEPEGFELPSGRYLPDFYLRMNEFVGWEDYDEQHDPGFWVEVKPTAPTPREFALLQELSTATRRLGFFLSGGLRDHLCAAVFPQKSFPWPMTYCDAHYIDKPPGCRYTKGGYTFDPEISPPYEPKHLYRTRHSYGAEIPVDGSLMYWEHWHAATSQHKNLEYLTSYRMFDRAVEKALSERFGT